MSNDDNVYRGQEQVEGFLITNSLKDTSFERGSFSQLLKQAYILSQDQVTDFITSEDSKQRYKALANIMGLKPLLIEFDNVKKILSGLENKRKLLIEEDEGLNSAIQSKFEAMNPIEVHNLAQMLNSFNIKSDEKNIGDLIEKKVIDILIRKSSLEDFLEFYSTIDKGLRNESFESLSKKVDFYNQRKKIMIYNKERTTNIKNHLNIKSNKLLSEEKNLEHINSLKNQLTDQKNKWMKLGIQENNINHLKVRLEDLRTDKMKLEFNLNLKKNIRGNELKIEGIKDNKYDIANTLTTLNKRLEKITVITKKLSGFIDDNKDQILARLISGIKDIQIYTNKNDLDFCPVCSSKTDHINIAIESNLSSYSNKLQKDAKYFEKAMNLLKRLGKKEKDLNDKISKLRVEFEQNNFILNRIETEFNSYKNSELFEENLFIKSDEKLNEEFNRNKKEIQIRQDAMQILLEIQKISEVISDNVQINELTFKTKSPEEIAAYIEKNKKRLLFVESVHDELDGLITETEKTIEKLKVNKNNLKRFILDQQFDKKLNILHDYNISALEQVNDQLNNLNLLKELIMKNNMNESIRNQISNIKEKGKFLAGEISKFDSFISLLSKYKENKHEYLGNGIADFLNQKNSTVKRYFRYLNPIPNNSDIIFEGDNEQLNIKVAFNRIHINKPGGKSNAKNILSSGQLNVLAISIFLAINEEQKIHSLDFIGIDDPIQNMDDINQYSMCDVLNNINKQLIISTHDMNFLKLFIKKNDYRKEEITVYNFKSPYIDSDKITKIEFNSTSLL